MVNVNVKDLHTIIGIASKSKNHHAKIITDISSLTVIWTTHHPRGISLKDTAMARYCDEQAALIGTVEKGEGKKCGPSPSDGK
ncbi:hypothetical protein CC80DRAFT_497100 [Byssothecium circinans]|uniref:4a-hydroxytetrahydrobiopterin dehydratase n=1 Tax=Byssothecium circinans TaxID=147558 RepID=A0A6A5TCS8_9PLEO|nr:hypothetical protein CC80DRAFT_497100 [Byssothecium circinans]